MYQRKLTVRLLFYSSMDTLTTNRQVKVKYTSYVLNPIFDIHTSIAVDKNKQSSFDHKVR